MYISPHPPPNTLTTSSWTVRWLFNCAEAYFAHFAAEWHRQLYPLEGLRPLSGSALFLSPRGLRRDGFLRKLALRSCCFRGLSFHGNCDLAPAWAVTLVQQLLHLAVCEYTWVCVSVRECLCVCMYMSAYRGSNSGRPSWALVSWPTSRTPNSLLTLLFIWPAPSNPSSSQLPDGCFWNPKPHGAAYLPCSALSGDSLPHCLEWGLEPPSPSQPPFPRLRKSLLTFQDSVKTHSHYKLSPNQSIHLRTSVSRNDIILYIL